MMVSCPTPLLHLRQGTGLISPTSVFLDASKHPLLCTSTIWESPLEIVAVKRCLFSSTSLGHCLLFNS